MLSLEGLDKRGVRFGYSLKGEPLLYIADLDYKEKPLKYKVLAGLGISDQGNPMLFVSDKEGKTRAALLTKDDGTPSLTFYDEKGAVQRQETAGAMQKGPMWVLWLQGEVTLALSAWPTKAECEAPFQGKRQEMIQEMVKKGVWLTCLPDTVNLRGKP